MDSLSAGRWIRLNGRSDVDAGFASAGRGVCSVHQSMFDILDRKVVVPFQFWMLCKDVIVIPVLIKGDRSTIGRDADEACSTGHERRPV